MSSLSLGFPAAEPGFDVGPRDSVHEAEAAVDQHDFAYTYLKKSHTKDVPIRSPLHPRS